MKKINLTHLTSLASVTAATAVIVWMDIFANNRTGAIVAALVMSSLAGGMFIAVVSFLQPMWKRIWKPMAAAVLLLLALACAASRMDLTEGAKAAASAFLIVLLPICGGNLLTIGVLSVTENR